MAKDAHPFGREGVVARVLPFAAAATLAFATVPLPPGSRSALPEVLAAAALCVAVIAATLVLPWELLPRWAQAGPPLAYLGVVALLRDAEGGSSSGFGPLLLLPVVWLALYGTSRQLVVAIALTCSTLVLPIVLVGPPEYPETEWRRAIIWMLIAPIVGFTTQRLVGEVRRRSETQAAVADVAHEIAGEGDARVTVCEAARKITGAPIVALHEPDGEGSLAVTAAAGADLPPVSIRLGHEASASGIAFVSRQPYFVAEARGNPTVSQRLVEVTGGESIFCQPVPLRNEVAAVITVIWTGHVRRPPPGVPEALSLLATETAIAIERSALVAQLREASRSDPLTGLANRRVLDEELPREIARAGRDGRPLCVALLDLDHFKAFNDSHGHQAGDRLLKEAASSWRSQLRDVDLLARYGGEEFLAVLHDCDLDAALMLAERMRATTPGEQTCSVGVVQWDDPEDGAALVGRADRALYAAKQRGRDRVIAE